MDRLSRKICIVPVLLILFGVFPVGAQQNAAKDDNPATAPTPALRSPWFPADETDAPVQSPDTVPSGPIDMEIRVLRKADPYKGFNSPLAWGPFSIDGATFTGIQDRFDVGGGVPSTSLSLGLMSINVAFKKAFRKSQVVLQYTPQAVIQQGDIGFNPSSNNNFGAALLFNLTPRLTVVARDQFVFNQTKQVFSDDILEVYRGVGGILPADFLQNNGSYLSNTTSLAFAYKLTPRWTLTTEPLGRYISIRNTTQQYYADGLDLTEHTALSYALTPRSNLSLGYNFEMGRMLNPRHENSYYHGAVVFYSSQIAPTLWIQGAAGAEAEYVNAAQGPPPVIVTGAFAFTKELHKTSFALAYARDKQLANYIGSVLTERVDLSYTVPVSRLSWRNGAGYFHELSTGPTVQGKYVQTSAEFAVSRGVSLVASYSVRFQRAATLQLQTGTHNTLTYGIRWQPPALPGL